jgi:predicted transposase YdaD
MSLPYDAISKGLVEIDPASWPALTGHAGGAVEVIDADISTVTGASDKVLRISGQPPWLMDLNFQRGPDASLPRRTHKYNALLEDRHDLLVRSVVVLLTPAANLSAIDGRYVRAFPGEPPHIDFRYQVIRVWQLPVASLLKGGLGTLPLAPISAVTEAELSGVVAQMKQRVAQEARPAIAEELWTAAYVLMGLRYREELVSRVLQGVLEMEESVTYQAIIRKGQAEGQLREARKNLLLVGTKCLGDPSKAATAAVNAIADLNRLEQLIVAAVEAKSWEALLGLPPKRTRRKSSS